jgi:hypothetical protein
MGKQGCKGSKSGQTNGYKEAGAALVQAGFCSYDAATGYAWHGADSMGQTSKGFWGTVEQGFDSHGQFCEWLLDFSPSN